MTKKTVMINAISSLLSRLMNVALLFWLNQFLIKNITSSEFSLYPVAMSVIMLVAVIRSVLNGGLVRHLSIAYINHDNEKMSELISSNFILQLLGGAIIFLFGCVFSIFINFFLTVDPLYVSELRNVFIILFGSFVIRQLILPLELGIQLKQRFDIINLMEVVSVIIRIVLVIALFKYFHVNVLVVVLSNEISLVVVALFRIYLSKRMVPDLKINFKNVKKEEILSFINFSKKLLLISIAAQIQNNADPIILNNFSDPHNVTCFYIGTIIRKQLFRILTSFIDTFIPGLSSLYANNQIEEMQKNYIRFGKFFSIFYFAVACPVFLLRKEFISLYVGNAYQLAATVIFILSLDVIFSNANSLYIGVAIASGKIGKIAHRVFIIQCINLILTIIFNAVFHLGAIGSALGTFVCQAILMPIFLIPVCIKIIDLEYSKFFNRIIIPIVLPTALSTIIYYLFQLVVDFPITTWIRLIIMGCSIVLIFLIFVFFLSLDKSERDMFLSKIKMGNQKRAK